MIFNNLIKYIGGNKECYSNSSKMVEIEVDLFYQPKEASFNIEGFFFNIIRAIINDI